MFDVAIVGGGIAGVTVACQLLRDAPWLRLTLLEESDRLGGKVLTERVETEYGRFVVECGPDAYLAQKPWARDLALELGLRDEIIPINSTSHPVQVMKRGAIHDLPDGIRLIAPTKVLPFLRGSLLGPRAKLRGLGDFVIPPQRAVSDESLGSFVRRRLGTGVLDWIAEPLVAGIYNADPERLSLAATFPFILDLEMSHRSVIRGLRTQRVGSTKPGTPLFETFRDGTATLIDALSNHVRHISRTKSHVSAISRTVSGAYSVHLMNDHPVTSTHVVMAGPAASTAAILKGFAAAAAEQLSSFRTEAAGSLSLAFRRDEINRPVNGYGLVIPAREHAAFNAITVASEKFPGRAPEGWTLIRLFFGGYRSPATMHLDDRDLMTSAMTLLSRVMGISTAPLFSRVTRWPSGSPQYDVGHLDRVNALRMSLPPGVSVIGSPYDGVGLPDIVRSATALASQLRSSIHASRSEEILLA